MIPSNFSFLSQKSFYFRILYLSSKHIFFLIGMEFCFRVKINHCPVFSPSTIKEPWARNLIGLESFAHGTISGILYTYALPKKPSATVFLRFLYALKNMWHIGVESLYCFIFPEFLTGFYWCGWSLSKCFHVNFF